MKTVNSGIYTITNTVNNKMYVGFTNNFYQREKKHFSELQFNRHANTFLQNAYNKNGKDCLIFEVLEVCDVDFLYSQEHYWCNLLNTHDREYGYNIRLTSPIGNHGIDAETRIKISNSLKGIIQSEATKLKRKASVTEAWQSPILREAQRQRTLELNKKGLIGTKGKSSNKKGKPFAGDKQKLSQSLIKYRATKEGIEKSATSHGGKPFNVYKCESIKRGNRWRKTTAEKGDFVLSGVNLTHISKELKLSRRVARWCLKGKIKQCNGYIFEYIKE